jgi:hypothetical protein
MTKKIDPAITGRKPRATKAEMAERRKARHAKVDRGHFSLLPGILDERRRELEDRKTRQEQAEHTKICNSAQKLPYVVERDSPSGCVRPGADDGLAVPSRVGDRLHYRSGLVADIGAAACRGKA